MKIKQNVLFDHKVKRMVFTFFFITAFLVCFAEAADDTPEINSSVAPAEESILPPKAQLDYHNNRGKIFYDGEEYTKAIEEFEQSLNLDPNNRFAIKYLILANQAKTKQDIEERLKLKQRGEKLKSGRISPPVSSAPVPKLAQTPPAKPKKEVEIERPIEYIISEGDTIEISVWEWPDLKTDVIVRPDGKISFPLIGDIHASGLTLTQLDQVITDRLEDYIRYPEVLVVFKGSGGKKVILLGEVGSPGVYTLTAGRYTILEAIAQAGGFNNDAVLKNVVVIRGGPNNPKPISLNLLETIKTGDLSQDIPLETEDIVYVPKTIIANVSDFINRFSAPINQSIYTKKTIREWQKR